MEPQKVSVVIIEDEFVIAEDIRLRLEDHGYEVLATFDKAESALSYTMQENPDLVLADIQLAGDMNGIELVKELQKSRKFPVVYITANSDSATYEKARATHPNAFLIKPFTSANLLATVDLALFNFSSDQVVEQIERQNLSLSPPTDLLINQFLFVRTKGGYRKVLQEDILFVEAFGSYAHIQTTDQRYTLSQNLAHFQRKTPLPNLVRIHRSFIVNINRVDSFEESNVFVQNHKLPLSDNFKADFLKRIHCL